MIRVLNSFDLKDRHVLIRVDFNVPVQGEKVTSNFRIKSALPTIQYCLDHGAAVILLSHLGRPDGKVDSKLSLIPIGEELAGLLEMPIKFSENCISEDALDTSLSLKPGEIHLLENLRFHEGEEKNDPDFAFRLARHGQIFINDAFGTAHRAHASNVGVVSHFKHHGIGYLMDKEINYLDRVMRRPNRPLTLILGGAKIGSKIGLIDHFLNKANHILVGGGMAFTFLKAGGRGIGGSLVDEAMIPTARTILDRAQSRRVKISLPKDVVCGEDVHDSNPKGSYKISAIPADLMGLDIGPKTVADFNAIIDQSETVVWNGPMGIFEMDEYSHGSRAVGEKLAQRTENEATVVVGGGDTAAAVDKFGLSRQMTHVSTGGGASLELLSGKRLPALKMLEI